jgi:hypothetical protein
MKRQSTECFLNYVYQFQKQITSVSEILSTSYKFFVIQMALSYSFCYKDIPVLYLKPIFYEQLKHCNFHSSACVPAVCSYSCI